MDTTLLAIAQTHVVVVYVAEDDEVALHLEGESDLLVEAGLEDLALGKTLDFLGVKARVARILCQEFQRFGELGPCFFRGTGSCGEPLI